jgi:hypothetical protein
MQKRSKRGKLCQPPIEGAFIYHRLPMLDSPAWRVLTLSARRVLDRLELEHMIHAGRKNGELIATYDNLQKYGIGGRREIKLALAELEALGFIEFTRRGRGGNADFRIAHQFRLTYLNKPTYERDNQGRVTNSIAEWHGPTDEWNRINTLEEAEAKQKAARLPRKRKAATPSLVPVPALPTSAALAMLSSELDVAKREIQFDGADTATNDLRKDEAA